MNQLIHFIIFTLKKDYNVTSPKQLLMKAEYVIVGVIVLIFAAILLGDAILATYSPSDMMLSSNDVKGITGMVFVVLAAFILWKAKQ